MAKVMHRVIVRPELPHVSRRLVSPVMVSCFGVGVALIVIDAGDSGHASERAISVEGGFGIFFRSYSPVISSWCGGDHKSPHITYSVAVSIMDLRIMDFAVE